MEKERALARFKEGTLIREVSKKGVFRKRLNLPSTEEGTPPSFLNKSPIKNSKVVEKKLQKSEALQYAILQALPGFKFLLNDEGQFVFHYPDNEESLFISTHEDIKGKNLSDVFPVYVAQAILTNIKWSIEHEVVQHFEFIMSINDEMQYFEARINAVNNKEVIALFKNITDKKIAKEELKKKFEELDVKNRELKKYIDSNLELENFAYIASHDLREPIRTIKNFAKLLESRYKDKLDETAMRHIRFIVDGAAQMNNLVEDLLTYSRVNTTNHEIQAIDIKQTLLDVLGGLDKSITETKSIITIGELPEDIKANPTKMKQLLLNLISNAIKFKKPNTSNEILIEMKDYGEYWKLTIEDSGIGIKKEFQEQIFLLFKKLHDTQHYPGTGLGLAICEKIVKQHDGDIWVESKEGEGAMFCCTIKKNLEVIQ